MRVPGWRVRKLRVRAINPGDVVVVQGPDGMTFEDAQGVDSVFFSHGIKCIVLAGGLKIVGIRPERDNELRG